LLVLEFRPALKGLADGDLVGEIEVRADRQAHGQTGDPEPEAPEGPGQVKGGRLAVDRGSGDDDLPEGA
jgi:hypothetical protein